MICLVHDGADRVLLARQPVWPEGRFSVLAGFVEAGESLEACVLREIHEEVGVPVRDVAYLGSQAWPFPRSLMVGFQAVADADAPLRPAEGEIAEAMWVTRGGAARGAGARATGRAQRARAAAAGRGVDRPRDAGGVGRGRLTRAGTSRPGRGTRCGRVHGCATCARAEVNGRTPYRVRPLRGALRRERVQLGGRPPPCEGFVSAEPSGKRTVGTVRLPPLTFSTNAAASGSRSMLTSS